MRTLHRTHSVLVMTSILLTSLLSFTARADDVLTDGMLERPYAYREWICNQLHTR